MAKTERPVVLVDSNVLIDVLHGDPVWCGWSEARLERMAATATLAINPLIYAEVSAYFSKADEMEAALPEADFLRLALPFEAAFLAGQAYRDHRRRGGTRTAPLPDFFIGAHAQVCGLTLLTRDARRYRTYFPELRLVAPEDQETP